MRHVLIFLAFTLPPATLGGQDPGAEGGAPQLSCGDTDGNSLIEVSDAVRLLNFLFLGGEPPRCPVPVPDPAGVGARAGRTDCDESEDYTSKFRLQDCQFATTGGNAHFILEPERQLFFEGEEDGVLKTLVITTLEETRPITLTIGGRRRTITTRVVEEHEEEDGEVVEISRNFYAVCVQTHDVYYFGEEVDIYEDGEIVSHDGAWLAGRDGAQPGIIMPGTFLLGSRYFQEVAPDVAMDRARHTAEGLTVETPFGVLRSCVEVIETTPLEPGAQSRKVYAPGIGLVVDSVLQLVDVVEDEDDDDD